MQKQKLKHRKRVVRFSTVKVVCAFREFFVVDLMGDG